MKLLFTCSAHKITKLKAAIDSNFTLLTNPYKEIYYFALGCHAHLHHDQNQAIEYYRMALTMASDPFVTALVHYHLAAAYCISTNYINSLLYLEESIKEFKNELNLKRVIAAYNLKGLLYMGSRLPKDAKCEFVRLLQLTQFFNEHYLDPLILNNLIIALIELDEYSSAYHAAVELIKTHKKETAACYFYAVWSAYRADLAEEAMNLITEAQSHDFKNDFHKDLIELTKQYLLKEKAGLQLVKCYRMISSKGSDAMKIFILRRLIAYHNENPTKKSLRAALKYSQELNSLLSGS